MGNTLAYEQRGHEINHSYRQIVAQMTTQNGSPLSIGHIPSGRLKTSRMPLSFSLGNVSNLKIEQYLLYTQIVHIAL